MDTVTRRMPTRHLREREADTVILRHVSEAVPPHGEYVLTDRGRSLMPILEAMADRGARRLAEDVVAVE